MLIPIKRKKTPNTKPQSIRQLQKAVHKSHVVVREANRLERLRHGRIENASK